MINKRNLFMFDMDGTLTKARNSITQDMVNALKNLKSVADIAIISGSDLDYIKEQCQLLFENIDDIILLPCNGTKYYLYKDKKFNLKKNVNMKSYMGDKKYRSIINALLKYQIDLMSNYEYSDKLSYTGTFIDYRESMINWCPIGRKSNSFERSLFEDLDATHSIRTKFLKIMGKNPVFSGLSIKYGGNTSFDIYPVGWDKSYPLENMLLDDYLEYYFIGDRCEEGGNDFEIFSHPKVKGYKTSGPLTTIDLINKLLLGI